MTSRHIATFAAFALCCTVDVHVQTPTFRSGVDAVQLDVAVTRDGRPVSGLTGTDFIVTDNGRRQTAMATMMSDVPLRVTLVLDVSASVRGERLSHLTAAAQMLSDRLRSGDEVALITFSNLVQLRVPAGPPSD